jgi:hypothetical protein
MGTNRWEDVRMMEIGAIDDRDRTRFTSMDCGDPYQGHHQDTDKDATGHFLPPTNFMSRP